MWIRDLGPFFVLLLRWENKKIKKTASSMVSFTEANHVEVLSYMALLDKIPIFSSKTKVILNLLGLAVKD